MIKISYLSKRYLALAIILIFLIIDNANSEKLEAFTQNKQSLKLSSNEIIYDKSVNKYILLGNVIIEYGLINIKSDNVIIYPESSISIVNSTIENILNDMFYKFYILNQYQLYIDSRTIEFDMLKNEISITNAVIINTDDKNNFCYVVSHSIIINIRNGIFKACGGDNKVKMIFPYILDLKKLKFN